MKMLAELLKFIRKNKVIVIFFTIDSILLILHLFFSNQYDFFNLDKEWNLPSFWSSFQFLFLAYLVFFTKLLENVKIQKYWQYLASIFFVYLASDELFQIHEKFGDLLGIYINNVEKDQSLFSLNPVFAWIFVFLPIILLVLYLWFFYFCKRLDKNLCFKFNIALFTFLFASYALEILGWLIWQSYCTCFPYALEVLLEESLEMLSVSYLIAIMWQYKK